MKRFTLVTFVVVLAFSVQAQQMLPPPGGGGGGGSTIGDISGLQSALDSKAPIADPTFTGLLNAQKINLGLAPATVGYKINSSFGRDEDTPGSIIDISTTDFSALKISVGGFAATGSKTLVGGDFYTELKTGNLTGKVIGIKSLLDTNAGLTIPSMIGFSNRIFSNNNAVGTACFIDTVIGHDVSLSNVGAANYSAVFGERMDLNIAFGGSINDPILFDGRIRQTGTGTITGSARGMYFHNWSGAPTTSYVIYADSTTNIGATNWFFYNDSTAPSFTKGNMTLGTGAKYFLTTDDAYNATTWDGNLELPTKNAIRDKFNGLSEADFSTTDITTNDVSTSKHGLVPKAPNDANKVLIGTGLWADDVNVQAFTTAGAGTWNKPTKGKTTEVYLVGGGGGGGSGRKGATTSGRSGGGGGSGGAFTRFRIATALLGSSEALVVGGGGAGGAPQATASTNGTIGTVGTASTFGTNFARAGGGLGGAGGSAGTSSGGAASTGEINGGIGGTGTTAGVAGGGAAMLTFGATGGGAGAPLDTSDVSGEGGSGGVRGASVLPTALAGGAGATIANGFTNGQTGNNVTDQPYGGSGGGGGRVVGSTPGTGGLGGQYGGGGGGGSAGQDGSFDSGRGGNGGDGIIVVITY